MTDTTWEFSTKRFHIELKIEQDYSYQYDGDDENGETQRKLENSEYTAFDSCIIVYFDGIEIGRDSLCGSVYEWRKVSDFWTAHRDPNPMNRNCSLMRAVRGNNMNICHYFPSMVTEAVKQAREFLTNVPHVRQAALRYPMLRFAEA